MLDGLVLGIGRFSKIVPMPVADCAYKKGRAALTQYFSEL